MRGQNHVAHLSSVGAFLLVLFIGSPAFSQSDPLDESPHLCADATDQAQVYEAALTLDQIQLSIAPALKTPALKPLPADQGQFRSNVTTVKNFQWTATNEAYRNLMFENPLLERHGISRNERLEPIISGAKFFKSGFLFPVRVIQGTPRQCDNPQRWGTPSNFNSCNGR